MQHHNQIDHRALQQQLQAHGFNTLLTPLVDGQTQPLAPAGWIRRDGALITYGNADRIYYAGGGTR